MFYNIEISVKYAASIPYSTIAAKFCCAKATTLLYVFSNWFLFFLDGTCKIPQQISYTFQSFLFENIANKQSH